MLKLKEIVYRGGLVRFRVPAHWVEELEPEGGGTFYDPAQGSRTLRLNVITMCAPERITPETMPTLLRGFQHQRGADAAVRDLANGRALLSYTRHTSESGARIVIRYWELGAPVPPAHARLAVFSYTVLEDEFATPAVQETLSLLDREISAAQFAPELSE